MLIAERQYRLKLVEDQRVIAQIFLPQEGLSDWSCRYQVDFPDRKIAREVFGIDSAQALITALQAVSLELYASPEHKQGRLVWEKAGEGYGFPPPKGARSMLVGEDKIQFG